MLCCAFALYAAFATRTYYWDGVLFALNIENTAGAHAPALNLLHPNHLIYTVFGYWLYRGMAELGVAVRALVVLQAANVLASIAAGAVFYAIAKHVTQSAASALSGLCLFSFGAIWWVFSTDADPYIFSVLFVLLAVWFGMKNSPRWWAACACHVAAMLFHELAVFAYAPLVAILLLNWQLKKAIMYVAGSGASMVALYAICYAWTDHRAYPTVVAWLTSYASDSGFTRSFGALLHPYLTSYLKLFAGGRWSLMRESFSAESCLGYLVCAAGVAGAVWKFRHAGGDAQETVLADRRFRIVFWAWLLAFAAFLALWDPGSTFHKLFVWPAMVMLIVLYVPRTCARALLWLAVALAGWNFAAFIYPHSRTEADPVLVLAQKIDRELPKDAVVYYRAFSPDDWYLDYFAPGRRWVQISKAPNSPAGSGLACFETTALEVFRPEELNGPKWDLVNRQHNVRLECREGR